MVTESALLAASRGSVVAPAGCGKTELIARAVTGQLGAGTLVLTHTHAGVKALRDRLRRLNVSRRHVRVETIAGWCLRYASSYPETARLANVEPVRQEWNSVYDGALRVLQVKAMQRVVRSSYTRVLVDEYQDCTARQHAVVLELAKHLPSSVLGDPLQGIFGFGGGNLRWKVDVESNFPSIGTLEEPWRWKGKNEPLGRWLLDIRGPLERGEQIDLEGSPAVRMALSPENQRAAAHALVGAGGAVVAVRKWPKDAHAFARSLGGVYPSMEAVDCDDLLAFAGDIDRLAGPSRAARLVRLAAECFTVVGTSLEGIQEQLDKGEVPSPARYRRLGEVVSALATVSITATMEALLLAMRAIERIQGAKLFRRELWREAVRSVAEFQLGQHPTLWQTAWNLRNRHRSVGRSCEPRSVSRTLLIKGLEFDHALVLNADEFEDPRRRGDGARHFYVAATRGARSLTLLSAEPQVRFSPANL